MCRKKLKKVHYLTYLSISKNRYQFDNATFQLCRVCDSSPFIHLDPCIGKTMIVVYLNFWGNKPKMLGFNVVVLLRQLGKVDFWSKVKGSNEP